MYKDTGMIQQKYLSSGPVVIYYSFIYDHHARESVRDHSEKFNTNELPNTISK